MKADLHQSTWVWPLESSMDSCSTRWMGCYLSSVQRHRIGCSNPLRTLLLVSPTWLYSTNAGIEPNVSRLLWDSRRGAIQPRGHDRRSRLQLHASPLECCEFMFPYRCDTRSRLMAAVPQRRRRCLLGRQDPRMGEYVPGRRSQEASKADERV